MVILAADLPDFYFYLNREVASGRRWLVFNELLVLQNQTTVQCFASYASAKRFIARRNKLTCRCSLTRLRELLRIVVSVLLQRVVPPFIDTQDYVNLLNYSKMNTKNVEYLKDSLRYLGFGSFLNDDLEKNIINQVEGFHLKTAIGYMNKRVDYTLYFRRSQSMDMYFFNRYQASIAGQHMEPDRKQTFYINKGGGITAREAFNLLEGRSVYKQLISKEGVRYKAWLKLDPESVDQYGNFRFRHFNDQYGYELEKVLSGFPIRELKDPEETRQLLVSLQKGNLQAVHFQQPAGEEKFYIYAQPQFKTIGLFDDKLNPVGRTRAVFPASQTEPPSATPATAAGPAEQPEKSEKKKGRPGRKKKA